MNIKKRRNNMSDLKIGITENGDASIDYTWEQKAPDMDMMVLITKNVTDEFIKRVLPYRNKVILHATCTGYGGTVIEPNVPEYTKQLEQVRKLIAYGFPAEQIVIRIDPIIPTVKGCNHFEKIVENIHMDVKRFRISVIDNYNHVKDRFKVADLPVLFDGAFQASDEDFARVDRSISRLKFRFPDLIFESCAEPKLNKTEKIGCVSKKDKELLGLPSENKIINKNSRFGCLCEPKTELLPYNHCYYCAKNQKVVNRNDGCEICDNCKNCKNVQIYGCSNMCLYCYWKT